jgi:hypothetical protein
MAHALAKIALVNGSILKYQLLYELETLRDSLALKLSYKIIGTSLGEVQMCSLSQRYGF